MSPFLTVKGMILPSSSRLPVPRATTSPSWGFSLAVSGMMIPPFLTSALRGASRERGPRGVERYFCHVCGLVLVGLWFLVSYEDADGSLRKMEQAAAKLVKVRLSLCRRSIRSRSPRPQVRAKFGNSTHRDAVAQRSVVDVERSGFLFKETGLPIRVGDYLNAREFRRGAGRVSSRARCGGCEGARGKG